MNKKTCYITTPIYYASGNLHIGHLYTTTVAWVLANYKKLQGYDVKLITGSDEHGQKIYEKALEQKLSPQEFVNQKSELFKKLWSDFKIDIDFIRTTDKKHEEVVNKIFDFFVEQGLIYKDKYDGLYSVSDEEFLTPTQAILKEDGNYYHPESGHKLINVSEESYFFKMNQFNQWIIDYIEENPEFLAPKKSVNEMKNNFLKNLNNLSVTRTNVDWGIKWNKDPKHTIYVWLDALCSYITALGFDFKNSLEEFDKYWKNGDEIIHLLGKEIARFHFVYWPIFIKGLNLRQPSRIQSHGWIVTPTGKMSKSKNNVVDPYDLLNKYHHEMIKYYFTSQIALGEDGIYDEQRFKDVINADLINNYGNLVSRTLTMISNSFDRPLKYSQTNEEIHEEIENKIINSKDKYIQYFDNLEIDKALKTAIELSSELNKYIDLTKPWTLKENKDELEKVLIRLLNGIYAVSTYLSVVLPEKINEVSQQLSNIEFSLKNIENFSKFDNIHTERKFIFFERLK